MKKENQCEIFYECNQMKMNECIYFKKSFDNDCLYLSDPLCINDKANFESLKYNYDIMQKYLKTLKE